MVPVLEIRNLNSREVKYLPQCHSPRRGGSMGSFNKGPIWPSPSPKHHNEVLMATLRIKGLRLTC